MALKLYSDYSKHHTKSLICIANRKIPPIFTIFYHAFFVSMTRERNYAFEWEFKATF